MEENKTENDKKRLYISKYGHTFKVNNDNKSVTLVEFNISGEATIPKFIDNYVFKCIGKNAFYKIYDYVPYGRINCKCFNEVVCLPNSIRYIHKKAFVGSTVKMYIETPNVIIDKEAVYHSDVTLFCFDDRKLILQKNSGSLETYRLPEYNLENIKIVTQCNLKSLAYFIENRGKVKIPSYLLPGLIKVNYFHDLYKGSEIELYSQYDKEMIENFISKYEIKIDYIENGIQINNIFIYNINSDIKKYIYPGGVKYSSKHACYYISEDNDVIITRLENNNFIPRSINGKKIKKVPKSAMNGYNYFPYVYVGRKNIFIYDDSYHIYNNEWIVYEDDDKISFEFYIGFKNENYDGVIKIPSKFDTTKIVEYGRNIGIDYENTPSMKKEIVVEVSELTEETYDYINRLREIFNVRTVKILSKSDEIVLLGGVEFSNIDKIKEAFSTFPPVVDCENNVLQSKKYYYITYEYRDTIRFISYDYEKMNENPIFSNKNKKLVPFDKTQIDEKITSSYGFAIDYIKKMPKECYYTEEESYMDKVDGICGACYYEEGYDTYYCHSYIDYKLNEVVIYDALNINLKKLNFLEFEVHKFKKIKNPSYELMLLSVDKDPKNIQYIGNPSEELQRLAVMKDPWSILHIKNPSKEIQIIAVEKAPSIIKYFKEPNLEVQLAAIIKDRKLIQYIENPCIEVQFESIKYDPCNIKILKEPAAEVQLAAIKSKRWEGEAIRYIENPCDEAQLESVKLNPENRKFIKNPSFEVERYLKQKQLCIKCGSTMVLRKGIFGEFYGCACYPSCTYTRKK